MISFSKIADGLNTALPKLEELVLTNNNIAELVCVSILHLYIHQNTLRRNLCGGVPSFLSHKSAFLQGDIDPLGCISTLTRLRSSLFAAF